MTMKWLAVTGLAIAVVAPQASGEEAPSLKTRKEKTSYGIGVDLGRNFKRLRVDIDPDLMMRGFKDALTGDEGKLLLTEEELRIVMNAYQRELRQSAMRIAKQSADTNRKASEAVLAQNAKKEGVVTLPSGLQYRVLKAATGKTPADGDTVDCKYKGTLTDGTVFDGSGDKPATFNIAGVIPGWKEALKLMPVGSKWQLFIPPQLAYGERGAGRDIGPNATLIFEVELLAIK